MNIELRASSNELNFISVSIQLCVKQLRFEITLTSINHIVSTAVSPLTNNASEHQILRMLLRLKLAQNSKKIILTASKLSNND